MVPGLGDATPPGPPEASAFTRRLLDRRLVIPAVPAGDFVSKRGAEISGGVGVLKAAWTEGRAASGGELVDLRRPVAKTCIHRHSPSAIVGLLMLRLTHSRRVTKGDIVGARRPRNMIKTKSSDVYFMGISWIAPVVATGG
jgi:hypothetical protein